MKAKCLAIAQCHAKLGGIAVQRDAHRPRPHLVEKRTMTSNMRSRCPADLVLLACQEESTAVRAQNWEARKRFDGGQAGSDGG